MSRLLDYIGIIRSGKTPYVLSKHKKKFTLFATRLLMCWSHQTLCIRLHPTTQFGSHHLNLPTQSTNSKFLPPSVLKRRTSFHSCKQQIADTESSEDSNIHCTEISIWPCMHSSGEWKPKNPEHRLPHDPPGPKTITKLESTLHTSRW